MHELLGIVSPSSDLIVTAPPTALAPLLLFSCVGIDLTALEALRQALQLRRRRRRRRRPCLRAAQVTRQNTPMLASLRWVPAAQFHRRPQQLPRAMGT